MFIKSFIYLTIILIIAISYNADLIQAKSFGKNSNLMKKDDAAKSVPEFESSILRIRRDVKPSTADKSDIPKHQLYAGTLLRSRRQTETDEFGVPKGLQNMQLNREKRQMPIPPGELPMPPM